MSAKSRKILNLLRMLKDLEMTNLSKLVQDRQSLAGEIAALQTLNLTTQLQSGEAPEIDLAIAGLADQRWKIWLETELRKKNIALAQIAAKAEQQSVRAQTALGRQSAFAAVLAKQRKARHRQIQCSSVDRQT